MYLEVRYVVLTIESPHLGLEKINNMLRVALEYDFCNVVINLDHEYTRFALHFRQARTSMFVEQWVKFWMRPHGVDYSIDFEIPGNGKELETVGATQYQGV